MNAAPLQSRSRRTFAALVVAAETLLDERPFDEISIQAICAAAGCSTGAFYGRFRAKEDLLPHLQARYDMALAGRFEALFDAPDWSALSLAAMLETYVREILAALLARPNQLRELGRYARREADTRSLHMAAVEARLADLIAARTPKAPPGEAAFVLFTLATVARELCLYSTLPPTQPAARELLVHRLIWMGLVHMETRS